MSSSRKEKEDDKEAHRHYKDPQVGFREEDPRRVDHQYELDRLFREWHNAETPFESVQKGNAIMALVLRWINYSEKFDPDDRKEAENLYKGAQVTVKTEVELRARGQKDEHYYANYDGVPMVLRGTEFGEGMRHIRVEADRVQATAQVSAISGLMGICDRKEFLDLDYTVGLTTKDEMKQGMGRRSE